jgi:hypothetical protein
MFPPVMVEAKEIEREELREWGVEDTWSRIEFLKYFLKWNMGLGAEILRFRRIQIVGKWKVHMQGKIFPKKKPPHNLS